MARDICVAVGERVRALRKARGWRQIDLAEHSGINVIYLSHVERGTKQIGLRYLEALANALDVSLSDFLKDL